MLDTTNTIRGVKVCIYLFKEFLLDGDVVISDTQNDQSIFGLLDLRGPSFSCVHDIQFVYQLILYQDQCLHGMLQSQFMLAHLTEDGADVQMDITRIGDLQAVIH